jgi:hypothetical protein
MERLSLEKVREVFTDYECEGLHIRCQTPWATSIEVKPGDLDSDTGSWLVGDEEVPAATLEAALIVACEMVNRG